MTPILTTDVDALFKERMLAQGYFGLVKLGAVWVGLHDYLTTRGLVVGLTDGSYERRYCYPDRASANAALSLYTDPIAHPLGPWVKIKGALNGEIVDEFNPSFSLDAAR
jgi:hypothetical protein